MRFNLVYQRRSIIIVIIIANTIALIASFIMIYAGTLKQKNKIVWIQSMQFGLCVVNNLMLGGLTGAIINTISVIRNIICYKNKLGVVAKIVITVLSVVLSLGFNTEGIIGFLPLIAAISFLWLMNIKSVCKFKLLVISSLILWLIYDISIKSYVSSAFDFISIIVNSITFFKIKNEQKNIDKNPSN